MGVSPAYFREQGCCDMVRHALCGKIEIRSSIGQQAQWPQSREEDGFSGAEGLLR